MVVDNLFLLTHDAACARASNREAMLSGILKLARRMGATLTSHTRAREITVTLARGPYRVLLHFDGGLKLSVFLAHWHTADASSTYPQDFPAESINRYHWGKATTHAVTFGDLLDKLEAGFKRLAEPALTSAPLPRAPRS